MRLSRKVGRVGKGRNGNNVDLKYNNEPCIVNLHYTLQRIFHSKVMP